MLHNKNEKYIVLNDAVIFDLVVFVFFLTLTIMSFDYNPRARSIPLGLGTLGSIMMFFQLLIDSLPRLKSKLQFVRQSGILGDENETQQKESESTSEISLPAEQTAVLSKEKNQNLIREWWRVLRITLWLTGFIVLLALTQYLVAVSIFIIAVTRIEAKESWKRVLVLTICIDISFFLLFNVILQAQL